jgi:glycosyltransferase involved in cell wall biosynthesis
MTSVLHVCTFFGNVGGVEKTIMDVATRMSDGFEVEVLCTKPGLETIVEQCGNVKVTRCGSLFTVAGRPFSHTLFFELANRKVDIVHYHLPFPLATLGHLIMPPKARAVLASWYHDLVNYPRFNQLYVPVLEWFLRKVAVIQVIFPGQEKSSRALQKVITRCRTIPLGVDSSKYSNSYDQRQVAAIKAKYGSPMVLFVGRLVYYKGIEVLIEAMASIDGHAVIVGEGPLREKLENQAAQLGLSSRVHFTGRLPESDLVDLYHACELFVLPSTVSTECFGLVQAEAMLCGKAVVNTTLPTGVPWVSLDDESGLSVAPGDTSALAKAINRLLKDDELRLRLGEAGRQRALAKFTLSVHVAAIEALYNDLLQEKVPIGDTLADTPVPK